MLFNFERVGLVKVAYVADYGNFRVAVRQVSVSKRKCHAINPVQARFLTASHRHLNEAFGIN